MTFMYSQPKNFNLLQTNNYRIVISRLPTTTFFTQTVTIPSLDFPPIDVGTPLNKIHYSGNEVVFGHLEFEFKVDEDMKNYREIFNWLIGLGFPDDTQQYINIKKNLVGISGLKSDCSVQIITSSNVPDKEIYFRDIFPIYLGPLVFETRNLDVNYVTCVARFSILDFTIKDVIS